MDMFPDFKSLSDADLKRMIEDAVREEEEISYRRRLLHGRIDILRAELVDRIKRRQGVSGSESSDAATVERLTEILAHRGPPPSLEDELRQLEDE
jgi:hypothetical protein